MRFVLYTGISQSDGKSVPCEFHKQSIIKTITKGIDESLFQTESKKTASDENTDSIDIEFEHLEKLTSPFTAWLDDIVKSADETVVCSDDGDRDNVMYKPTFANDFIRLCKILPLWSAISCDLFEIDEVTSSSSNVESDFKNLKQSLADIIPCSVDTFVEEHIELLRGATIEASQQNNYLKFIGNENIETEKSNDAEVEGNESGKSGDTRGERNDAAERQHDSIIANSEISLDKWNKWKAIMENADHSDHSLENIQRNQSPSHNSMPIVGCRNGGEPGGAHRCIECDKAVHILPCCSVSIGDEEGYGERRLCNACVRSRKSLRTSSPILPSVSQAVSEMEYNESWNKTKKKTTSKYMKTAPNWSLNLNIQKKVKLGILQNGNLSNTTYKIDDKQKVALTNTCTFDSICQVHVV